MTELRDGAFWLAKLSDTLINIVTFMALDRYGQVPDVDDRVSDALAALIEAAHDFEPRVGQDKVGYFLHYVLACVAGKLRSGASTSKRWRDEAVTFTDLEPEQLGIEYLWETVPGSEGEEPEEALFVLNNGMVASTLEIIELVAGNEQRSAVASKLLGVKTGEHELRFRLLQALDELEYRMNLDNRWERPGIPEPVCHHKLRLPVVVSGVQVGTATGLDVEEAARGGGQWAPDEASERHFETDNPWPKWLAADQTRSYRSPYADDNMWPDSVTRHLWLDTLEALAWPSIEDVLDAVSGGPAANPEVERALDVLDHLALVLADEPDGSTQRVAGALAFRVKSMHRVADKQELYEIFCEHFGVDGTPPWEPETPSANSLRDRVREWVRKVAAHGSVWPSQAAAIEAMVLHGASGYEARQAASRVFNSPIPQWA